MDCNTEENTQNSDSKNILESVENFQKFIFVLLENNGILNDLRAYFRGQIANVLCNLDTGVPPRAHKNFTQRLQFFHQAINIIIAEYLIKMEFSYSFSVFIAEIPLSNMVFDFSKELVKNSECHTSLQFTSGDIWRILSYLGLPCDSVHASRILEMYQGSDVSFLMCMFKCLPLYNEPEQTVEASEEMSSGSSNSVASVGGHRCRHYAYCKTCRGLVLKYKKKYKRKKIRWTEKTVRARANVFGVDKKLKEVEEKLIDEMFEQLKCVYEGEIDLIREEEQKKAKRSQTNHALLLQQDRDEMEEKMKERQDQMEQEVRKKKEFVWGLTSALRETQARLAAADGFVKEEAERLTERENAFRSHVLEAEKLLQEKSEEMHKQISNELSILDGHLQTLRREREAMDRERRELESLRERERASDANVEAKEKLMNEYASMKDELATLRKYIESTRAGVKMMNNEHGVERANDERLKQLGQAVNDLKNTKKINISQTNMELNCHSGRESNCWTSSEHSHQCERVLRILSDENERVKQFAIQQRSHIEMLTLGLRQAQAARPVLPTTAPSYGSGTALNERGIDPTTAACRPNQGGGEELRAYTYAGESRAALAPSDFVPFIGVVGDRRPETRRWWQRVNPRVHGECSAPRNDGLMPPNTAHDRNEANEVRQRGESSTSLNHKRIFSEYAPKTDEGQTSTPKVAPKQLKKDIVTPAREKSPEKMLREAKAHLRKLEIEAEAVEKSYRIFSRKREDEKRKAEVSATACDNVNTEFGRNTLSSTKIDVGKEIHLGKSYTKVEQQTNMDYDRYLREYQMLTTKDLYKSKNSVIEKTNPIPRSYLEENINVGTSRQDTMQVNYLETPMVKFRKFYNSSERRPNRIDAGCKYESRRPAATPRTDAQQFKILQSNIKKIYNINSLETLRPSSSKDEDDANERPSSGHKRSYHETTEDVQQEENLENNQTDFDKNRDIVPLVSPRVEVTDLLEENNCKVMSQSTEDLEVEIQASIDDRKLIVSNTVIHEDKVYPQVTVQISTNDIPTIDEDGENSKVNEKESDEFKASLELNKQTASGEPDDVYISNNRAVFNVDSNKECNHEMANENLEEYDYVEYPDDFSADVDNYNTRSECSNNSPISIMRTSEDENFWDI